MWGIQVFNGKIVLPELIIDAEKQHDAEQAYCEHFGLVYEELKRSSIYYSHLPYSKQPRFIRSEVEYVRQDFDLQIF